MTSAGRLWCTTCGEYVRPGSHGIHASNYGRGPSVEASVAGEPVSSVRAVALVVLFLVGGAFAVLLAVFYATQPA